MLFLNVSEHYLHFWEHSLIARLGTKLKYFNVYKTQIRSKHSSYTYDRNLWLPDYSPLEKNDFRSVICRRLWNVALSVLHWKYSHSFFPELISIFNK